MREKKKRKRFFKFTSKFDHFFHPPSPPFLPSPSFLTVLVLFIHSKLKSPGNAAVLLNKSRFNGVIVSVLSGDKQMMRKDDGIKGGRERRKKKKGLVGLGQGCKK